VNQVDQQIEICRRNPNLKEFGETIERLTSEVRSAFDAGWNAHCDLFMEDHIEMEREEAWKSRDSGRQCDHKDKGYYVKNDVKHCVECFQPIETPEIFAGTKEALNRLTSADSGRQKNK